MKTILSLFLFISLATSAQLNTKKLDSLFTSLEQNDKSMGSFAISKGDEVIYKRDIGIRAHDHGRDMPSDENTRYRIGSISKMFTATMIFQLIEEKKLTLETKLDKFFPKLPNAKLITIGNLLNHHSGLHNFTNDAEYGTYMTQPKTHDEMLAIIASKPADFQPGEKGEYSNSNYVVLGYIIEQLTKKTFAENLRERITSRIGLANTYVGGAADVGKNECYSFSYLNGWNAEPETDMSIPGGAGAVVSTPSDLTKFIDALFALKLTSESSLNQMKTLSGRYGMGMFKVPFGTKSGFGHTGGIDGFSSSLAYFPEDDLSIAYISNGGIYPVNDVMIAGLSIYYGVPYTLPEFKTVALSESDLEKYLGTYSSAQMPLQIFITNDGATLVAQATGQSSFPLEATAADVFKFNPAGIELNFTPGRNEMILKQGGGEFLFTKATK